MDVKQGMLNDSWLLAAMAALSQDHILLNQVIPPNRDWSKGYGLVCIFNIMSHMHLANGPYDLCI